LDVKFEYAIRICVAVPASMVSGPINHR